MIKPSRYNPRKLQIVLLPLLGAALGLVSGVALDNYWRQPPVPRITPHFDETINAAETPDVMHINEGCAVKATSLRAHKHSGIRLEPPYCFYTPEDPGDVQCRWKDSE